MCSILLILGARQCCFYLFASLRTWRPCGKAFASLVLSGPCSLPGSYHDNIKVYTQKLPKFASTCLTLRLASSNINFKMFLDLVLVVMHKSFIIINGHMSHI